MAKENGARIKVKLGEMDGYIAELEGIVPESFDDYAADIKIKRACEKTIELAIEATIDVCYMLVAYRKLGVPESEDSVIDMLVKNKVISDILGKKLNAMKGFRNLLVHKYGEVDDNVAYSHITEDTADFDMFKKEVQKAIK